MLLRHQRNQGCRVTNRCQNQADPRRMLVSSAFSGLGRPPHIFGFLFFLAASFHAVLTWLYVLNAEECIVGLTCPTSRTELRHPWRALDQWGGPGGPLS